MPPRPDPRIARKGLLRHVLTAAGFSEAIGFTFIEAAAAPRRSRESRLTAPGRRSPTRCRRSSPCCGRRCCPGLVDAVAHNRRRDSADVRLFEIGAAFSPAGASSSALAFAWTGAGTPEHWSGGQRAVDFFDAKGVVERIGDALRPRRPLPGRHAALAGARPHRRRARRRHRGRRRRASWLPAIAEARDLPGADDVYVAELDLDALDRLVPEGDAQFEAAAPLPVDRPRRLDPRGRGLACRARSRDHSSARRPRRWCASSEFDRYKGKDIPEGRYSLSLRLTFRSPDRTLVDAEVQQAMDRVVEALVREHGAVQR